MIKKYAYIEIRRFETEEVVKRVDVTGRTETEINKCDRGMNINLNHNEYYTISNQSDIALLIIPIN